MTEYYGINPLPVPSGRLPQILARIPQSWGKFLSFAEGWDEIVSSIDAQISDIYPDYEIYQVKEKFGGLRYYCEHDNDPAVRKILSKGEDQAWHTCELCGSQNDSVTTEGPGWITTRCISCRVAPKAAP